MYIHTYIDTYIFFYMFVWKGFSSKTKMRSNRQPELKQKNFRLKLLIPPYY